MTIIKVIFPASFRYFLNSWRTCWFLARNHYVNLNTDGDSFALRQNEIQPTSSSPNRFYINPTLGIRNSKVEIFYRETNVSIRPEANRQGQMRKIQTGSNLVNSVHRGTVMNDGKITHSKEIIESQSPNTLEDVRVCYWSGKQILIGTQVNLSPVNDRDTWRTRVAMHINNNSIPLASPVGKRFEKNWVPIEVVNDELHLLHSNNPSRIVSVSLITGTQRTWTAEDLLSEISLSGGSQFALLKDSSFLRVARKRYPLFDRGYVHISFIVSNDSQYRETNISTPFTFRDFGFEICNGLVLTDSDDFCFSWGENDLNMYLGICNYSDLLSWFQQNHLNKHKKRNFVSSISKMLEIRLSL